MTDRRITRGKITRGWTTEELARLGALLDAGASSLRAAAALKRSIVSVQQKARELGRPFPLKRDVKRELKAREAQVLSGENFRR